MKESASYQVWIGQHDMMMPRCIVMNAVSAQIRAMMHQIHHSWVPQIYILDAITSHIFEIHLSSILQQIMSKKSTYIWGANKKKDDDNISNRQLLLTQAMLLVGHGCCEQQNVSEEAVWFCLGNWTRATWVRTKCLSHWTAAIVSNISWFERTKVHVTEYVWDLQLSEQLCWQCWIFLWVINFLELNFCWHCYKLNWSVITTG